MPEAIPATPDFFARSSAFRLLGSQWVILNLGSRPQCGRAVDKPNWPALRCLPAGRCCWPSWPSAVLVAVGLQFATHANHAKRWRLPERTHRKQNRAVVKRGVSEQETGGPK